MTKDGAQANTSYLDYRMPTALDLPNIDVVLVEKPNPGHPFGVRGVGEVPICPPIAAIGDALHNALGKRFYDAPMKPGRILNVLGKITDYSIKENVLLLNNVNDANESNTGKLSMDKFKYKT